MHRMQQEFQVLTAKISGLDEKKKKKSENVKHEASWRTVANQFSYLPKVQMK